MPRPGRPKQTTVWRAPVAMPMAGSPQRCMARLTSWLVWRYETRKLASHRFSGVKPRPLHRRSGEWPRLATSCSTWRITWGGTSASASGWWDFAVTGTPFEDAASIVRICAGGASGAEMAVWVSLSGRFGPAPARRRRMLGYGARSRRIPWRTDDHHASEARATSSPHLDPGLLLGEGQATMLAGAEMMGMLAGCVVLPALARRWPSRLTAGALVLLVWSQVLSALIVSEIGRA